MTTHPTAAAAEPVPADSAPKLGARFTVSTITDDQLDALYAERDLLRLAFHAAVPSLEARFEALASVMPRTGLRGAPGPAGGPR